MSLLERITGRHAERYQRPAALSRFGWDDYLNLFSADPFGQGFYQTITGSQERVEGNFDGIVNGVYKRSGVVFACLLSRLLVFSEARFQWRGFNSGRPGNLFGGQDLALLERPWPGATTGDLLARMEQDSSLAGAFFATRRRSRDGRDRIVRLRPDWVTIVLGSYEDPDLQAFDLDAELIGYIYQPPTGRTEVLLPEEVCHYAPIPDPAASFRGMSLLQAVIRDIEGDQAATTHKLKFFENGASPNMVVTMDASVTPEVFERFKAKMETNHRGAVNAYRTLYLGGGADVKTVGNSFEQMSYKAIQALGETRIAAALGVPPVIVGLSEGLASATYSNYAQARRRFGDGTLRPLWRNAAGSLASLLPSRPNAQLWYDDRDVSFLREDKKDAAEIFQVEASTIASLVREGFTAKSAQAATAAQDSSLLVHTGLLSVQLQPPGAQVSQGAGTTGPEDKNDDEPADEEVPDGAVLDEEEEQP
ncbi:phage portal protein (plasmid) [Nonomuraea sp. CA-143628]|uniref:phage portal protein n=1 Tax=Nonomuraea sp. CA-143628 TaxID=3239997 RepID=UPI003D8E4042